MHPIYDYYTHLQVDEGLLLEQLVPHGEEGDGQTAAEEEDEVDSELEPEDPYISKQNHSRISRPVVDGEW